MVEGNDDYLNQRLLDIQAFMDGKMTLRECLERDPAVKDVDEELRRIEEEVRG